jgi:TPP-dependent pyruvate/acetoin dehydrogenase alpha subunit
MTTDALDEQADYRDIYRIRRVEEALMSLVSTGEITGSIHLCIGQEAIPVGACRALQANDPVVATYRGHGWAIARGVPVTELFAEVIGRDSALNAGRGGSAYLSAPQYGFIGENSIVGAGLPMALGLSLAAKFQGKDQVALVAIGDGAMNQGAVHETLNMAAVLGVPLIVVVENNGYVEMTPSDLLTAVTAAGRAGAYRAPVWDVDGNDAAAVATAVAQSRATARAELTPVIVEVHTKRLAGHYSGDVQQYRPKGEVEAWRLDEPLRRLEGRASVSESAAGIRDQVDAEVSASLDRARQMPLPDVASVLGNVYVS